MAAALAPHPGRVYYGHFDLAAGLTRHPRRTTVTGTDVLALVPWLLFGVGLAVLLLRLHGSGRRRR